MWYDDAAKFIRRMRRIAHNIQHTVWPTEASWVRRLSEVPSAQPAITTAATPQPGTAMVVYTGARARRPRFALSDLMFEDLDLNAVIPGGHIPQEAEIHSGGFEGPRVTCAWDDCSGSYHISPLTTHGEVFAAALQYSSVVCICPGCQRGTRYWRVEMLSRVVQWAIYPIKVLDQLTDDVKSVYAKVYGTKMPEPAVTQLQQELSSAATERQVNE